MKPIVVSVILLALTFSAFGQEAKAKKRKPGFTVSKETTYVTGPLDKDGYVDYRTALNERLGKGVTPENNANVMLWKAMGPHPLNSTMPAEFWKWMKVAALPEKGDYFLNSSQFTAKLRDAGLFHVPNAFDGALAKAVAGPWKTEDHPLVADWLSLNEKPLTVAMEATRRSHFFLPLVRTLEAHEKKGDPIFTETLTGTGVPSTVACRELAHAWIVRAMLNLRDRPDDAWQDLLACHRLVRLVGRGGTLIDGLTGNAIDTMASQADIVFIHQAKLDAKQLKSCLRDLQSLPPTASMADKMGLAERFMFLDAVMFMDRSGATEMGGAKVPVNKDFPGFDWNPTLRKGNQFYARAAAAMRLQDRALREKHLAWIDRDIHDLRSNVTGGWKLLRSMVAGKDVREGTSNAIGDILIALMFPNVIGVQRSADRSEQTQRNLRLAFALAAFKADTGAYPKNIDALAPKYLPNVPNDLFSGKALIYRPTDGGYLLYSVGVNGRDDEGHGYGDEPPGDDLSVRMPMPKQRMN